MEYWILFGSFVFLLLIGTPLDFRLKYGDGWAPSSKLIQIENDAAELNHNREADVAMVYTGQRSFKH